MSRFRLGEFFLTNLLSQQILRRIQEKEPYYSHLEWAEKVCGPRLLLFVLATIFLPGIFSVQKRRGIFAQLCRVPNHPLRPRPAHAPCQYDGPYAAPSPAQHAQFRPHPRRRSRRPCAARAAVRPSAARELAGQCHWCGLTDSLTISDLSTVFPPCFVCWHGVACIRDVLSASL